MYPAHGRGEEVLPCATRPRGHLPVVADSCVGNVQRPFSAHMNHPLVVPRRDQLRDGRQVLAVLSVRRHPVKRLGWRRGIRGRVR